MIIAGFIILSIPVGYLLGGKLGNVKNYTTRALGLPIAAFLLESAAPFLRNLISLPVTQWHWILVTAEYLLLFSFCVLNRRTKAVWLIFAACVLNYFVIALYNFQMPVSPYAAELPQMAATIAKIESGEYFRYTLASASDPFWFLGDIIVGAAAVYRRACKYRGRTAGSRQRRAVLRLDADGASEGSGSGAAGGVKQGLCRAVILGCLKDEEMTLEEMRAYIARDAFATECCGIRIDSMDETEAVLSMPVEKAPSQRQWRGAGRRNLYAV